MITRLKINNFKSLIDFEIPLGKLTCLVGLNGSGKSSVLQAIHLLSHIMSGKIEKWLSLPSYKYFQFMETDVDFEVDFIVDGLLYTWISKFSWSSRSCLYEKIFHNSSVILEVDEGVCNIIGVGEINIIIKYPGSILSALMEKTYKNNVPELSIIKKMFNDIVMLGNISPNIIRLSDGYNHHDNSIGLDGERLTVFLKSLPETFRDKVIETLREKAFLPSINKLEFIEPPGMGTFLFMNEKFPKSTSEAKMSIWQVSDGFLHQLAILSNALDDGPILLIDELENGTNQEVVGRLVDILVARKQQVIITTHNPILINYIPDDMAKEGVIFLYRNKKGDSQGVRFFNLPEPKEKLTILGPGEAYVDCKLHEIADSLDSC